MNCSDTETFISNLKFATKHQEFNGYKEMEDDRMSNYLTEYSRFLNDADICEGGNENKKLKIQRLTAENIYHDQKFKNIKFSEDENIANTTLLKNEAEQQQNQVSGYAKETKERIAEENDLKETGSMESEKALSSRKIENEFTSYGNDFEKYLNGEQEYIPYAKINEHSILKSNLRIIIADLKLAHRKILELDSEIRKKDELVREYRKYVLSSERILADVQYIPKFQNPIKRPLGILKKEKEKFVLCNDKSLQDSVNLNPCLDTKPKHSIIEYLKGKFREIYFYRNIAEHKIDMLEKNLITALFKNETLRKRIQDLEKEIRYLRKKFTLSEVSHYAANIDEGKKMNINDEGTETGGNELPRAAPHERKMCMVPKLKSTVEILQGIKFDLNSTGAENNFLESEVLRLRKMIKDDTGILKLSE